MGESFMNKSYVAQYARLEREHWWFRVRRDIIMQEIQQVIPAQKKLRILNVGAAAGASTEWLQAWGEVVSVEPDPAFIEMLHLQGWNPVQASVTALPFDSASFDLVCAFDVIEHVENDALAVRELLRVCRIGGRVVLTVPAFQSLWSPHDVVNAHFRRYRLSELQQLIQQVQGTRIIRRTYFNSILLIPVWCLRKWQQLTDTNRRTADFEEFGRSGWMNRWAGWFFSLEIPLLRRMRFPAGISCLLLAEKTSNS